MVDGVRLLLSNGASTVTSTPRWPNRTVAFARNEDRGICAARQSLAAATPAYRPESSIFFLARRARAEMFEAGWRLAPPKAPSDLDAFCRASFREMIEAD